MGLDDNGRPLTSVESIAHRFADGVQLLQPEEPYYVLGWCVGSVVAYELAQQLVSEGLPVAGLVLIDPAYLESWVPYLHHSGMALALAQAEWRKRIAQLERKMGSNPDASFKLWRAFFGGGIRIAIGTYTPKPLDVRTLLVCSRPRRDVLLNRDRGYPALIRDLEVVEVDAHKDVFSSDGVHKVAEAVDRFVDRRT